MNGRTFKLTWIFLLPAILIASGCATRPTENMAEYLSTKILPNGSKLFIFSMEPTDFAPGEKIVLRTFEESEDTFLNGPNVSREAQEKRSQFSKAIENDMIARLDEQLQISQYCREGYMLLDSSVNHGFAYMRGECEESATNEDRKRFPNGLTNTALL